MVATVCNNAYAVVSIDLRFKKYYAISTGFVDRCIYIMIFSFNNNDNKLRLRHVRFGRSDVMR